MEAWVFTQHGAAEDVLKLEKNLVVPDPTGRDLLVRLRSGGLNPIDYKVLAGGYRPVPEGGHAIPGYDGLGVVFAVGPGCTSGLAVGDNVFFSGHLMRDGTLAQYALVDERICARAPSKVEPVLAGALPLVYLTTDEGFENAGYTASAGPYPEKTVLVVGGAGGVGSMCLQYAARVLGFKNVVATASREETVEYCKEMGATAVVPHAGLEASFKEKGLPLADVVFVTTDLDKCFDEVVAVCGTDAAIVFITPGSEPLPIAKLFFRRIRLCPELMFTRTIFDREPERQGQALARLAKYLDDGVIKSTVNVVAEWAALPKALSALQSGHAIGKIAYEVPQLIFLKNDRGSILLQNVH
jgi:NADPH2:quinone reductase